MVLLSLFARSAVIGDREASHLYVFFMPAILLASTVLRHGGGILAVLLSAVLIKAFYIPPLWSAWVNDPDDAVAIVVFIGSGLVTAVMGSALHGMVQEMQHLRAFSLVLDVRHQDKARRSSYRSNRSPAGPSCNTGKLGGAALVTLRAMQSERFEPHGHIGPALTVLLPYRITRKGSQDDRHHYRH